MILLLSSFFLFAFHFNHESNSLLLSSSSSLAIKQDLIYCQSNKIYLLYVCTCKSLKQIRFHLHTSNVNNDSSFFYIKIKIIDDQHFTEVALYHGCCTHTLKMRSIFITSACGKAFIFMSYLYYYYCKQHVLHTCIYLCDHQ